MAKKKKKRSFFSKVLRTVTGVSAIGAGYKAAKSIVKTTVGAGGLIVKGVGEIAKAPKVISDLTKAPGAVNKLIKKGRQSDARRAQERLEGRTKKDLGIAARNIRDWKKDLAALDTSTSAFAFDTTLDELEGYVASAEGKKAYDQKELDKIATAINASRQREALLRERSAAPASSQFDFNTAINKDNLFNK